jgi:hypothetical protein
MLALFIEMTDQVFWEGYAQQLSKDNPEIFRARLKKFVSWYEQGQASPKDTQDHFIRIIQNNYCKNNESMAVAQS